MTDRQVNIVAGPSSSPVLIPSLILLTSPKPPDCILTSTDHAAPFLASDTRHDSAAAVAAAAAAKILLNRRGDREEEVVQNENGKLYTLSH